MLTADARVQTSDPGRYLAQFCTHAAAMSEHGPAMIQQHAQRARAHAGGGAWMRGEVRLSAECSATHGVITFIPWGRCTLSVAIDSLLLSIESGDAEGLERIQDVITGDLERWGAREHLKIVWSTPDPNSSASSAVSDSADASGRELDRPDTESRPAGRHRALLMTAGALGVALIAVVHLTLAGVIVSVPLWLGWTAAGLMVVAALMIVVHAVGPLTVIGLLRHTFNRTRPHGSTHLGK